MKTLDAQNFARIGDDVMVVDPRDHNITPSLYRGVWEERSSRRLGRILREGDTFVDGGAHWGYYSLLASRLVGEEGRVYAFEPVFGNYLLLCMNLAINDRRNVRALPFGLWSKHAILPFTSELFIARTGGSHVSRRGDDGSNVEAAACFPLDGLFEPDDVDFLKVDCEGSDEMVLHGAELILRHGHAKLMVENPPVDYLRKWGYRRTEYFEDEQVWFFEK